MCLISKLTNTLNYRKAKDNRKKEIEKMEKFLTAQSKIDLLTDRINKLDENPDEILKIYKETNVTKLKKDLDVERERYKSVKFSFFSLLLFTPYY